MMLYMGRRAREAARELALASTEAKNAALLAMAARLEADSGKIIGAIGLSGGSADQDGQCARAGAAEVSHADSGEWASSAVAFFAYQPVSAVSCTAAGLARTQASSLSETPPEIPN